MEPGGGGAGRLSGEEVASEGSAHGALWEAGRRGKEEEEAEEEEAAAAAAVLRASLCA